MRRFWVYIICSRSGTLYTGMTNNLWRRIREHKCKRNPKSFSARYNINRLVYFEEYPTPLEAIWREKQIKSWRRSKKMDLIRGFNPKWEDLSDGWYEGS